VAMWEQAGRPSGGHHQFMAQAHLQLRSALQEPSGDGKAP
jgi:hypothetical protein